jgi:predicted small lipoprotein YifL
MPDIFRLVLLFTMTGLLASCGVKGRLKTPDQIEKQEAKEAHEKEKKLKEAEEKKRKMIEEKADENKAAEEKSTESVEQD